MGNTRGDGSHDDVRATGLPLPVALALLALLTGALLIGAPLLGADGTKGRAVIDRGQTGATSAEEGTMSAEESELLEHVREIFQAFLDRDRERIRRLHAEDWIGFLGPSERIERGIEEYMARADQSLDSFEGVSYEILESEVRIHGDVGLVFYVARYEYDNDGEKGVVPLRSVDVFRRRDGEWIQTASHISVIPSGGRWGEGESPSPPPGAD